MLNRPGDAQSRAAWSFWIFSHRSMHYHLFLSYDVNMLIISSLNLTTSYFSVGCILPWFEGSIGYWSHKTYIRLAPKLQGGGTKEMGIYYNWGAAEETKGNHGWTIWIRVASLYIHWDAEVTFLWLKLSTWCWISLLSSGTFFFVSD